MRTQLPAGVLRYAAPAAAVSATVATVGLLSSGGSASAGSLVTSADIKNQTIRAVDIGSGGAGTSEIKNQSIRSGDIRSGGVGSSEIRTGAVHSDEIADGTIGSADLEPALRSEVDRVYDVAGHVQQLAGPGTYTIKLDCADYGPDGKVAVSGGLRFDHGGGNESDVVINGSYPSDLVDADGTTQARSWTLVVTTTADSVAVRPFIVCRNPG